MFFPEVSFLIRFFGYSIGLHLFLIYSLIKEKNKILDGDSNNEKEIIV